MHQKFTLVILIASLCCTTLLGQGNKIEQVENSLTPTRDIIFIDSALERYNIVNRMEFYQVPSVSIALINDGKIEWARAYGYADLASKKRADANTMYQVASITKSVNALAIMRLVQQHKLSLSADIREYLKSWKFPENDLSAGKPITLRNLLSHTAGLSVRGFIGYPVSDSLPTINQILDGVRPANNEAVRPIYAPGTHYQYSGGGSTVIRKILDDNISSNYENLLQELILRPLEMKHSTFSQAISARYTNYAHAYDREMKPVPGNYYRYPEQSAGGLWSTASDIAKFVLSIQNVLNDGNNPIVSKELMTEMLTPVMEDYGYGIGIEKRGNEKYFRHDGENFGFRSVYYGSFTSGKGVVILTNAYPSNGSPFITELLNSIATVYDWKGFYNPPRKKLINLPENSLAKYVGEYSSEDPVMKIIISKDGGDLILTGRRSEKMYPESTNAFFLASSPNDQCRFSSSKNDDILDTFEVVQNGKVIIKATKKP